MVLRLNGAIVTAINSPDLSKRLRTAGQTPSTSTADEFRDQIRSDFARWGQIVKITGAKVD
jgi:tripartite-type tricarboxylate transporter receptor subunit TctC